MQQPFLKKIVEDIELADLRDLRNYCYVFPTRRAGVYFKKYLTERFAGQYLWAPHIFSVVEFTDIHNRSGRTRSGYLGF